MLLAKRTYPVFTRDATGLVKEIGPFNAAMYAFTCVAGSYVAVPIIYLVLYPVDLLGPLPVYSWAILLSGVMFLCLAPQYAFLSGVMPRSGGDYVFTSRILTPYLGFIEGWTALLAWLTFTEFNFYYAVYLFGVSLGIGSFMPNGGTLSTVGNWILSIPGLFITGIPVLIFLLYVVGLRPTRTWLKTNTILGLASLAAAFLLLALFLASGTNNIDQNLMSVAGVTKTQVISNANAAGWSPASYTALSWGGLIFNGLFFYTGFQNKTYLAGEIKGNVSRNLLISEITGIVLVMVLAGLLWVPFIYGVGYNFVNAWSFLYLSGSAKTPLGLPPMLPILLALANPGIAVIAMILGILALCFLNLANTIPEITMVTHLLFAFSMDRMLPNWFSSVDEKRSTPVKATVFIVLLTYGLYAAQVLGLSPVDACLLGCNTAPAFHLLSGC